MCYNSRTWKRAVSGMRILVVEDERLLCDGIAEDLRLEKYTVDCCYDGPAACERLFVEPYDLVVLDLNLPGMDGLELLRHIRTEQPELRVLILSARSQLSDKVAGLDLGADDYLTKPFLTQELLLRIQRILQRCYRGELWRTAVKTLQLGQRTVYLADALVRLPDGTAQPLTATERALLQKLAENRGHIVTYDAVCEAVWGADYYGYENSLNVHIRHLREKLEPNPSKPQYLLTVRGIGYKLAEENAQ